MARAGGGGGGDLAAVKEGAGKAVDLEVEEMGEGSAAVVMGAAATAEGVMAEDMEGVMVEGVMVVVAMVEVELVVVTVVAGSGAVH